MNYHLFIKDNLASITPQELERAIASLPAWRREKALSFKFEQGRKECTFAYLLLCQALQEVYGITQQPSFTLGEHGKPSFLLGEVTQSNTPTLPIPAALHFNLSHCKPAIACVLADHPVGVDIERIGRYEESLARYVLNDQEFAIVQQSPDPHVAFIRYWTQKEAIVKLTGRGIDDDLKNLLLNYNNVLLHTEEHLTKGYVVTVAEYKQA